MENNIDEKSVTRFIEQIFWEDRKIYIDLFEEYLRSKMDSEEVVDKFFAFYYNHHKQIGWLNPDPEKVKKKKITSKSEGFNDLIEWIFSICEALDVEETDYNSTYPMSENRFQDEISLRLEELKDYD